jgi:hypothetical protein
MAVSTGWKRLHIAMLTLVGLWTSGWIIASCWALLAKDFGLAVLYAALGLPPLLLYLRIAWVVAGFLADKGKKGQEAP